VSTYEGGKMVAQTLADNAINGDGEPTTNLSDKVRRRLGGSCLRSLVGDLGFLNLKWMYVIGIS